MTNRLSFVGIAALDTYSQHVVGASPGILATELAALAV